MKVVLCSMNKEEFRRLLNPLSETEQYYRDHPEDASRGFRDMCVEQENGVYVLEMKRTNDSPRHGAIFTGRSGISPYANVVFGKQTRYSSVPLHRHNYLELFYIYEGSCSATINGSRVALRTGDVCIMDTQSIHAIDPVGEDDIVLNCLFDKTYFNAQFIGRLAASGPVAQFLAGALSCHTRHDQYLLFHTAGNELVRELFEDAFCEYLDPGVCTVDTLDSYMTLIFIQMARCYQAAKEQEYRADSRSYLTEVLRYIEEHYADCTLETTAAQFSFHPNYLSRAIKKTTGFSFKELVDQTRLRQAAFLLKNSSLAVNDIAAQCGWSNLSQFYRKFSGGYGCTPKEYRSRHSAPDNA